MGECSVRTVRAQTDPPPCETVLRHAVYFGRSRVGFSTLGAKKLWWKRGGRKSCRKTSGQLFRLLFPGRKNTRGNCLGLTNGCARDQPTDPNSRRPMPLIRFQPKPLLTGACGQRLIPHRRTVSPPKVYSNASVGRLPSTLFMLSSLLAFPRNSPFLLAILPYISLLSSAILSWSDKHVFLIRPSARAAAARPAVRPAVQPAVRTIVWVPDYISLAGNRPLVRKA